jgi:hypothetical protein
MQTLRGVWKAIRRERKIIWAFLTLILSTLFMLIKWLFKGKGYLQKMLGDEVTKAKIVGFIIEWGALSLFLLMGAILAYFLFRLCSVWTRNAKELRPEFGLAFNGLTETRRSLWEILDVAFIKRQQDEVDPGLVRESMQGVWIPGRYSQYPIGKIII